MRESYGDSAISYVQLKRENDFCYIQAKICPEHRVRNKPYNVSVVINEKDEDVKKAECHDCIASLGTPKIFISKFFHKFLIKI